MSFWRDLVDQLLPDDQAKLVVHESEIKPQVEPDKEVVKQQYSIQDTNYNPNTNYEPSRYSQNMATGHIQTNSGRNLSRREAMQQHQESLDFIAQRIAAYMRSDGVREVEVYLNYQQETNESGHLMIRVRELLRNRDYNRPPNAYDYQTMSR